VSSGGGGHARHSPFCADDDLTRHRRVIAHAQNWSQVPNFSASSPNVKAFLASLASTERIANTVNNHSSQRLPLVIIDDSVIEVGLNGNFFPELGRPRASDLRVDVGVTGKAIGHVECESRNQ